LTLAHSREQTGHILPMLGQNKDMDQEGPDRWPPIRPGTATGQLAKWLAIPLK